MKIRKRIRIKKYFGTVWFLFEGKNPKTDDDILSIKIVNLFKLKPGKFQLFSFSNINCYKLIIMNFGIAIYK